MRTRRSKISLASTSFLVLALCWTVFATGKEEQTATNKKPSPAPSAADKEEPSNAEERFDYRVREDFFAGLEGDEEAYERVVRACEEVLATNPRHAEGLVWRGAVRMMKSRDAFRGGDVANGKKLWATALKDMDDAVEIAPDHIGVLIPRAAVLLPAGRNAPPLMGKPVLLKVRADFERTYERQKDILDELGEHPLGELRMGLADVYRLLGEHDKSEAQLKAVQRELPETEYAERATAWLAASPEKKLAHTCIGCHSE